MKKYNVAVIGVGVVADATRATTLRRINDAGIVNFFILFLY